MLYSLGDWVVDVDVPLTMELSVGQAKEHCSCGYCRNYYAAVDITYPGIRPFLAKFGLDIEGPDELCPFEPTIYEATYILQGRILHEGTDTLYIDGIPLTVKTAEKADLDTEHPMPYFAFCIGLVELPWVLDEPMEEVISPANEDACLERMQRKLLERIENEDIYS